MAENVHSAPKTTLNQRAAETLVWALILLSVVVCVVLLISIDNRIEAEKQAHLTHDKAWETLIAEANDPEERQFLMAIRAEVNNKACHPRYAIEENKAYRAADPAVMLDFIRENENYCINHMIAKAKLQHDVERFVPILERISTP